MLNSESKGSSGSQSQDSSSRQRFKFFLNGVSSSRLFISRVRKREKNIETFSKNVINFMYIQYFLFLESVLSSSPTQESERNTMNYNKI